MPRPIELTKIPADVERQALALIVRGDRRVDIAKTLKISEPSVDNIKRRNADLLERMQQTADNYRINKATKILDKSQDRIISKLDDMDKDISIGELNALQREAHNQLRLETGKPTSISSTTQVSHNEVTPGDFSELAKALESGNEIELQRILFKPKDD